MKAIILGQTAGTRTAETLHIDETTGRLGMVEGDWLYNAFKKKACHLTTKNGFSREDAQEMEARALAAILSARDGYDAAKARQQKDGHKRYLNTIIANALNAAAKAVADARSIWSARQSLDAAVGEGENAATHGERLMAHATFRATAQLWLEPRCRRVARKLGELKRDERAKRRLLERLEMSQDACADAPCDEPPDPAPVACGEPSEHDQAVAEMGLADDADEAIEVAGGRHATTGFGDSAAAIYENTLHLDVAIVMNDLPPRLRRWCQKVLEGYSPVEAYRAERFSKTNFYGYALPQLRAAFAALRYAL